MYSTVRNRALKVLKYFYVFLWIFVLPTVIGQSVGDTLLEIYLNFNKHVLAGLFVCLLSGAVVTWFPMIFLVEEIDFLERNDLIALTLLLWAAGIVAPMLFGFQQLGLIITVLLISSGFITVAKLMSAISKIKK